MYLMYVDESGDPGHSPGASKHFILSGLIIHKDEWNRILLMLKSFRKHLKIKYGLNQRTEIHASELIRINKIKEYRSLPKKTRIDILKEYSIQMGAIFETGKSINICLHKENFSERDIFDLAWNRLLQRFSTFLKKNGAEKGLLITDDTDSIKLQKLHRKMRIYNPVPSIYEGSRNLPIDNIIEDPFARSSTNSYLIQSVDVISHLLYRKEYLKGSLKKYGVDRFFINFESILLKEANKSDSLGIVRK